MKGQSLSSKPPSMALVSWFTSVASLSSNLVQQAKGPVAAEESEPCPPQCNVPRQLELASAEPSEHGFNHVHRHCSSQEISVKICTDGAPK
jgi:hypothetical protein